VVEWEDVGLGCSGEPSGSFDSYRDLVLSEPSLWGLWPLDDADDTSGFHNLVGGGDPLTAHDYSSGFAFEQPGPFTAGAEKSILFQGSMSTSLGTGCWAATPTDLPLSGSDPFTVEMWAYPTLATWGELVSFRLASYPFDIRTGRVVSTDMELTGQIAGNSVGATGYILDLNAWHHIAATYDSATLRLYANGAEVGTVASAGGAAGTAFFGALAGVSAGTDTSVYFNGRLSLAAIYTAALDAATIATHAGV
jgi:hypothetical protein